MKKICIIGNIGNVNDDSCSGQVLRTRVLHKSLVENYGESRISIINTNDYGRRFLRIFGGILGSLFNTDIYILLLSRNGRKIFYPIMYLLKEVFGKHIFNNVIGGEYAKTLVEHNIYIKYSRAFDLNWVQTLHMKKDIEKLGVDNIEVLPNSKPQEIVDEDYINAYVVTGVFKFCTFSRIIKEKGIEEAIEAIEEVNKYYGEDKAELYIYGSVEKDYEDRFKEILNNSSKNIHYMGYVNSNETTNILKDKYILLFPTTWDGEGFPGTVLDAYAAALPVIATDWNCNSEVIIDGKTGFLYDINDTDRLAELVCWGIENADIVLEMKRYCREEALRYTPDKIMPIIYSRIDMVDS